jgi:hypothetical protein
MDEAFQLAFQKGEIQDLGVSRPRAGFLGISCVTSDILWVPAGWGLTRHRSGQRGMTGRTVESSRVCGWHMRQMCPSEMPSPTDGGSVGGML